MVEIGQWVVLCIVIKHFLSTCLQTQRHSPRWHLRHYVRRRPLSLYANLPQEWPLARLSVQLRHIGVLLRVTLYRRLAELGFRGVDFCQLPREVMKDICQDFDSVCGEMANRLASLFAFLKPASANAKHPDLMGQSLCADPGFWLYGLLSFCAKACETKTAEANGAPALRAKEERATPALEPNGKTLSLMQTVVMSFGRNQNSGRPDLPIHHVHIYFPAQPVHKLIERMKGLRFQDVTPEDTGTMAKVRPIVLTSSLVHTMVFVPPIASPPCHTRQR